MLEDDPRKKVADFHLLVFGIQELRICHLFAPFIERVQRLIFGISDNIAVDYCPVLYYFNFIGSENYLYEQSLFQHRVFNSLSRKKKVSLAIQQIRTFVILFTSNTMSMLSCDEIGTVINHPVKVLLEQIRRIWEEFRSAVIDNYHIITALFQFSDIPAYSIVFIYVGSW